MDIGIAGNITQVLWGLGALIGTIVTIAVYMIRRDITLNVKLDAIAAQQKPNGGSSMRDAVDKVSNQLDNLDSRLDSVEQNLANLRGSYDEHTKQNRG